MAHARPLLAQSRHGLVRCTCPLLGAKRTLANCREPSTQRQAAARHAHPPSCADLSQFGADLMHHRVDVAAEPPCRGCNAHPCLTDASARCRRCGRPVHRHPSGAPVLRCVPSTISAEMHLATRLWREIARPSRSSRFKHAASAAEARGSMTAAHECAPTSFKGRRCQRDKNGN